MLTRTLLCCLLMTGSGLSATGDPRTEQQAIDVSQIIAMAGGGPTAMKGEVSDLPKFEDVTKDMKSQEGLFTLWFYPADAKDKDQEKLLCQIPAGFLGEKFMLSISISGGGFFTGFPLEERVVQWELLDKQVLLVEPETRFVVDEKHPVSDVVRRTYPERIRTSVPLVTKSPKGDPVIDLGVMLKSNLADLSWMSLGPLTPFGRPAPGVNPALSKWSKKKAFELNVEIGVELAMAQQSPPGAFEKKLVHFSFWKLPASDYVPRVADDRVGYFLTTNQDWAKPTDSRDIFNRYIDRWHLEKRDPELSMCEPKQPIVFYMEKTVPIRFRKAVRDGILEWNKAYEKCGLVDAVQVRQQTDDNEWKDLDPEDMRYSFFRWIVTGAGFAMGPHRANPFSGQIYDADIIFDDSLVRFFEHSAQDMLPSTAAAWKTKDPTIGLFLEHHPQWQRAFRPWENFFFGQNGEAELREVIRRRMRERGHLLCDYSEGMKHQMGVAQAVLAGQPKEVIERFLYDVIKEVVMHEVGHTLGLRHNFKASSIYSLDEIRKRRGTGEATTGSVMDYNPTLFFKENAIEGYFVTPTIGPYDYWAIEYGYRPADGTYKTEKPTETKSEEKGTPEQKEEPTASTGEVVTGPHGQPIPKEVLDQLPPEVKKMIASGKAMPMMGGAGDPRPGRKPAASGFKGPNPAETEMLLAIASRAAEPELAYATDEDTTGLGPDPRTARFDQSGDPVAWARSRFELVNMRMKNILDWAVKDKESWYFARNSFLNLLFEKVIVMDYVGSYIGGQYTSRSHRGDPNPKPPFEPVDARTQREALAFIEENLFSDAFFTFPPEVLNHLAAPRWWHDGMSISFTVDFPIHDWIGLFQWWNLFDRLLPNTLRRIHDAELKTEAADKFTAAEYVQRIQNACWSDVSARRASGGSWSDASPFLSSIRRSLQREYLNLVEPLVRTPPGVVFSPDLHAMVQHALRKLNQQIQEVLETGKADFASEAHLTSCKTRIELMLTPELPELRPIGTSMGMGLSAE